MERSDKIKSQETQKSLAQSDRCVKMTPERDRVALTRLEALERQLHYLIGQVQDLKRLITT